MRPLFFIKKNLSNPFYLWTSAEIDFAFFRIKNAGAKRYVRKFFVQQCLVNGNPLIKYGGVIRFRHVLSFFPIFLKKLDSSWVWSVPVFCGWQMYLLLPMSSSVSKKWHELFVEMHFQETIMLSETSDKVIITRIRLNKGFYSFLTRTFVSQKSFIFSFLNFLILTYLQESPASSLAYDNKLNN